MFWASVVGSVACKIVLWNTTAIFTTNKYIKIQDNDFCSCISTNSIKQSRGLAVLQIGIHVAL